MATHWKPFTGRRFQQNGADKTSLSISINCHSIIRINRAAYELLGRPMAVHLAFDDQQSVIGVMPGTLKDDTSFPLNEYTSGNQWTINAAAFCNQFGISIDRTELFSEPYMDSEGRLRLDLKNTFPVMQRKNRAQSESK